MPDSLNARMAAALAPVLGEEAVYAETVYICSNGHINTRCTPNYEWGDECIECDGGAWIDDSIQHPVDFADPAVGWGVFERWCANITVCPDIWMRRHPDHCEAEITIYRHGPNEEHKGKDTSLWGAILAAWAQALGVSGDE